MGSDEFIGERRARELVRPPSEASWERWHRLNIIPHYLIPGTRQRRYVEAELIQWIQAGRRSR